LLALLNLALTIEAVDLKVLHCEKGHNWLKEGFLAEYSGINSV
jgi:hypothetical protein